MANPINISLPDGQKARRFVETFSDTGEIGPFEFTRSDYGIVLQITGTATTFTAIPERATVDPTTAGVNWAPVDELPLSANLTSDPLTPIVYNEPSRAWWRVRITTLSGGNVTISVEGEA